MHASPQFTFKDAQNRASDNISSQTSHHTTNKRWKCFAQFSVTIRNVFIYVSFIYIIYTQYNESELVLGHKGPGGIYSSNKTCGCAEQNTRFNGSI